jgi:hypothetical protein
MFLDSEAVDKALLSMKQSLNKGELPGTSFSRDWAARRESNIIMVRQRGFASLLVLVVVSTVDVLNDGYSPGSHSGLTTNSRHYNPQTKLLARLRY